MTPAAPGAAAIATSDALFTAPSEAPNWEPSQVVLLLGSALTLLVAAAVLWLGWVDYRNHIDSAITSQELMARVLEDHGTRTVDTASVALAAVADSVVLQPRRATGEVEAMLRDELPRLTFLRGLAMLDAEGRVLASTSASDRSGMQVALERLGPLPPVGQERLGRFVPGRSLADIASSAAGRPAAPANVGFIPVMRSFAPPGQAPLLLVAMLNPDALSNHQTLILGDTKATAVLTSYTADVLASSASSSVTPGMRIADHEVFRLFLASREHGTYEGSGLHPGDYMVAFRASRTRPIVALIEYPHDAVRADWWGDVRASLGLFGMAVLMLGGMTFVAWRGLRAREGTRDMLDQAQARIAQRERELSVTVKSVQELIFRTDASGTITFVNARWLAVSGTDTQKAIGMRLAELAREDQRPRIQALFDPQAPDGIRTAQIAVQTSGMASERLFDLAVVPLVQQGRIIGFAGSGVDATERVSAQRKLQTQLAITELMLEISPLPLSLRDLEGRYLSVNRAWEEFCGRRRDEVLGRRDSQRMTDGEHREHRDRDTELVARGGRIRYEANVPHADGSRRDVVLQKVLVPGDGGAPEGILAVLIDVSEFREAERATREARDAAEESSRAKSEFIANISHELRTPLQSILGFSELGAMRGRAQHPRLAGMFDDIHTSGQRMLALVNDLLDVAKLESAVGTMHLERTDLRPLLREVVRELAPQLADKALRLDESLFPFPLVAKVDPLRFQQVVRNVLANAIRFSPAQGHIQLRGEVTPQREIHIQILDQGPGIPPTELDRIFDAFIQSSTTKDGSGGTGLGLSISRKIMEIHGGRIQAENRPDGGAVFHIHLPARNQTETVPAPL